VGRAFTLLHIMKAIAFATILMTLNAAAAEPVLTADKARDIAILVLKQEFKFEGPVSQATLDPKTGLWTCATETGFVDGTLFLEIRDKDRFYRLISFTPRGRAHEFHKRTSLRRRIEAIVTG